MSGLSGPAGGKPGDVWCRSTTTSVIYVLPAGRTLTIKGAHFSHTTAGGIASITPLGMASIPVALSGSTAVPATLAIVAPLVFRGPMYLSFGCPGGATAYFFGELS